MCHPEQIDPVGYTLDAALMARPGNMEIQLDLFLDYANNVRLNLYQMEVFCNESLLSSTNDDEDCSAYFVDLPGKQDAVVTRAASTPMNWRKRRCTRNS